MAFATKNRAATVTNGFGNVLKNDTLFTNSVSLSTTSTQANIVPASGSFAPTVSKGYILVHIYNGGGTSPTAALQSITGTDGTATVVLYSGPVSIAAALSNALSASVAGSGISILVPFLTDLNLTSITVNTILGGTTPTATMDVDVAADI